MTNLDELHSALEGREPVAVVRAQGTGAWSDKLTTSAPLSYVEGVHNLYVVYNLPDRDNIGANIYGLYLDPGKNPDNIRQTLDNAESIQAYIAGNRIVVHSACDIHIDLYSVNGTNMDRKDLPSGTNTLGQFAPGIYILKATGTDRNTTTLKLIVR